MFDDPVVSGSPPFHKVRETNKSLFDVYERRLSTPEVYRNRPQPRRRSHNDDLERRIDLKNEIFIQPFNVWELEKTERKHSNPEMGMKFAFYQDLGFNSLDLKEKSKSFESFSQPQIDDQGRNFDLFEEVGEDSRTALLIQVRPYGSFVTKFLN